MSPGEPSPSSTVLRLVPQNPCSKEMQLPLSFSGEKKSVNIFFLIAHPLLSQNRDASPYLLPFLLKLNRLTVSQARATPCCILLPVIVLPSKWGKGYSNDPANSLTCSLFYHYSFTSKFSVIFFLTFISFFF